ncbi:hypothetical protein [Peribacillus sp. YIM B13477]|uniref:hypothetical protein n=1 Tax=Peribacillus sp. YIM B13477 TaxID=3366300 RepID=UPI003672A5CA
MKNKKVMEAMKELQKMQDMVAEMEKQLHEAIESQRPLNQKRYELIKAGGKKAEVLKVNEELKKVAEEIQFCRDQLEITKESIADDKHELVKSLLEYRTERANEMNTEMKSIEQKLNEAKFEYMKKVHELYTVPFNELQEELTELNDIIQRNGDGSRFGYPRVLGAMQINQFYAPTNPYGNSPFIRSYEIDKALVRNTQSISLKLFMEYNIVESDESKAEQKYRELKAQGGK